MEARNGLPEPTTMHWHGMHLPAMMDGGPHRPIEPGETWRPTWEVDQPSATLWYHPHPHGKTAEQVYRGVAGMFLVDDPAEADVQALLPSDYGVDDVPLIVQDRAFDGDELDVSPGLFRDTRLLGQTILVNGTPGPYLEVTTEHVRLRLAHVALVFGVAAGTADLLAAATPTVLVVATTADRRASRRLVTLNRTGVGTRTPAGNRAGLRVCLDGDMTNSLLSPSTLPFDLPDYANLSDADFREAIEQGMAAQLLELDAIAADTTPATVQNTLEAWERSGSLLTRGLNAFWVAKAADANDERDAIDADMAPRLAAHDDAVLLNADLYARLTELRERHDLGEVVLDAQETHLLAERRKDFERGGIALGEDQQARLRKLNTELATLTNRFDQLLVAGRNAASVHVTDQAELAGLDPDQLAAAREAAEADGKDGWLLTITNTTGQPVLADLEHRPTRERVFRASADRGLVAGDHDTRDVLLTMARLRAERARLLGYPHHAAYAAEDGCAGSTEAVNEILGRLGPAAYDLVRARGEELQAHLHQIEPGATLEPWDWAYVDGRLRQQEAELDQGALRPYLEFDRVLVDGVFAAATALYAITFHRREDLVGYTADARVYEVREDDGSHLGVVIVDPYTRSTKQGGAWMTSIVDQSELLGDSPVVTNTCNFAAPASGSPSLLSWDNVITLFHEFGHDLHGLLSDVRFPSRSGTSVPRDFVEFPSQVNEIWAREPGLLAAYARHHETGEPLPNDLRDQLLDTSGKETYRYAELLAAMILDQAWYQAAAADLPAGAEGVEAFELAALEAAGVGYAPVPPRYRSAFFHHIFGGGYSAAYYSYLWSEIMDADTVAWFEANGGMARESGEHFRRTLLGPGGSVDAMESYRAFRGGDPDLAHLLRRIGAE